MSALNSDSSSSVPMRTTGHAMIWAGGGRAIRAGMQVLYVVLLARAISPELLASAVIGLLGHQVVATLTTQPVHQALVQGRDWSRTAISASFWINALLCLIVLLIMVACGPLAARTLDLPPVSWLLPMIGLGALAGIPTTLPMARLTADMAFNRIVLIESVSSIVSGLAAIACLMMGMGLFSLAVFSVGQRIVEGVGFAMAGRWASGLSLSGGAMRRITGYSVPLICVQILGLANQSIDQLMIGKILSPVDLGLYGFGRRLVSQPSQMIAFAVARTSFPALVSVAGQRGALTRDVALLTRYSTLGGTAMFFAAALLAPFVFPLVLGPEWDGAAYVTSVMCIGASILPLNAVAAAALRAAGRTSWTLWLTILNLVLLVAALIVVFQAGAGLRTVAVAVAAVQVSMVIPCFWLAAVALGVPVSVPAAAVLRGAAPATLALGAGLLPAILPLGLGGVTLFAAEFSLAAIMFVVVSVPTNFDLVRFAIKLVTRGRSGASSVQPERST